METFTGGLCAEMVHSRAGLGRVRTSLKRLAGPGGQDVLQGW